MAQCAAELQWCTQPGDGLVSERGVAPPARAGSLVARATTSSAVRSTDPVSAAVRAVATVALFLALLCPPSAKADDWNNPGTGNWALDANWLDGSVPTSSDDATIANGGTAEVLAAGAVARGVTVGGSAGAGTLMISGGGTLSSAGAVIGTDNDGTVTVTGAGSNWSTSSFVHVGESGSSSALTVSAGGTVNVASNLLVGEFKRRSGHAHGHGERIEFCKPATPAFAMW